MTSEDRTIEDLKKDFLDEIEKLEEALSNYRSEHDLKTLKSEFPDKWKYLSKKLVYPYEYFNNLDDYQKPLNNFRRLLQKIEN